MNEFNKYKENHSVGWYPFYSAYTDGEVTLTCDKKLFGEEPGTNLTKYFTVFGAYYCLPIGIENTKMYCNFGEQMPETLDKFFLSKETWLRDDYKLKFTQNPQEKYDSLTFTITMPIIREHVRDYVAAQYFGKEPDSLFTHRVFKSDCLIKFDWK
ncbi:MAG: hypothetical protein Q4B93_05470 [Clostridia bacterium]|nr:hypothetical protein [Clostridia bacterium]